MTSSWRDDAGFLHHIPSCPTRAIIGNWFPIQSPSSFVLEFIITITSLLLALLTFCCYNSVSLPNRSKTIATRTISNTMWSFFFISVAVRSTFNAMRFGKRIASFDRHTSSLDTLTEEDARFTFITAVTSIVIHSFSCLFLMLALNYQRKYRSGYVAVLWWWWWSSYSSSLPSYYVPPSSHHREIVNRVVHDEDVIVSTRTAGSHEDENDEYGDDDDDEHLQQFQYQRDQQQQQQEHSSPRFTSHIPHSDMSSADDDPAAQDDEYYFHHTRHSVKARTSRWLKMTFMRLIYFIFSVETVVLILFYLSIAVLYLRATNLGHHSEIYSWMNLATILLQRLPILILCILIVFTPRVSEPVSRIKKKNDDAPDDNATQEEAAKKDLWLSVDNVTGPTRIAKFILMGALVTNIPNDIPLSFWYQFVLEKMISCPFYIASFYDAVIFFHWISLFLWFFFMRAEYLRNQEETMYLAVKKSYEYDFRNFKYY